jgi:hypothetical protein
MTRRIVFITTKQRLSIFAGIVNYHYLTTKYGLNTQVVFLDKRDNLNDDNMNEFGINSNDIVIPLQLGAMKVCKGLTQCFVDPPEKIDFLDDKLTCGKMVDSIESVPNIPTFYPDKILDFNHLSNFFDNNNTKNYLIKNRFDSGSNKIHILDRNNCINKLNTLNPSDYIIQPYYEMDYVLAIDCMCYKGVVHSFIVDRAPLFLKKEDYFFKNKRKEMIHKIIDNESQNQFYRRILEYTTAIIEKCNYTGLIEIEFLCNEAKDQIFYLEVNPRISLCCVLIDYKLKNIPYIDLLILKYIELFEKIYFNEEITQVDNIVSTIPNTVFKTPYILSFIGIAIAFILLITILYLLWNKYKRK